MTYDALGADTQGHNYSTRKVRTFWVVLDGCVPGRPLCLALPDGREAPHGLVPQPL